MMALQLFFCIINFAIFPPLDKKLSDKDENMNANEKTLLILLFNLYPDKKNKKSNIFSLLLQHLYNFPFTQI